MHAASRNPKKGGQSLVIILAIAFWAVVTLSAVGNRFFNTNSTKARSAEVADSSYSAFFPDPYAEGDTQKVSHMVHRRVWLGYGHEPYQINFSVATPRVEAARTFREHVRDIGPKNDFVQFLQSHGELYRDDPYRHYWTWIYQALLKHDRDQLPGFFAEFDSLFLVHRHDPGHFANLMVSFVQDIPYQLIHENSCSAVVAEDTACQTFRCRYHQSGKPCKAEVRYGLQSPVEFMYDLAGDCDTRALLLQLMLYRYGIDSKILISQHYAHAMIGVRLPAAGNKFVMVDGFKYYVWETTARHWQLGHMPPSHQDILNWKVVHTPLDDAAVSPLLSSPNPPAS
ncbi:MAG: hypothetical protein AAFV07_17135 [Bacteroidota bacterium]